MFSYYAYRFDQLRADCYKNLNKSSSQLLVNLCVEIEQTFHWKFKCWTHFAEIKIMMRKSDRKQKCKLKDGVIINSGCPQSLILLSEGSVGTSNQPLKLSKKQVHTVAMEREMKVTIKNIS